MLGRNVRFIVSKLSKTQYRFLATSKLEASNIITTQNASSKINASSTLHVDRLTSKIEQQHAGAKTTTSESKSENDTSIKIYENIDSELIRKSLEASEVIYARYSAY